MVTFKEDELTLVKDKRSKLRPVVVLDPDIPLCIVVEVTSHSKRDKNDYEIDNWVGAGLSKPSVIRFSHKI